MFPLWSTIVFAVLMILGAVLLVKSIGRMIAIYSTGIKIEGSALATTLDCPLPQPGSYEIAVKRPSITGIVPSDIPFQLANVSSAETIAVRSFVNLLSQRRDISGNRIVPIAEFTIEQPGTYRLTNPAIDRFKDKDKLIVMPKTGFQGFIMIFAILFSGILFIGGLVLFILSMVKK